MSLKSTYNVMFVLSGVSRHVVVDTPGSDALWKGAEGATEHWINYQNDGGCFDAISWLFRPW